MASFFSCTAIGSVGGIIAPHGQFMLVFLKYSAAMWTTILTAVPSYNSSGFGTAQNTSQNWTKSLPFLPTFPFVFFFNCSRSSLRKKWHIWDQNIKLYLIKQDF